MLIPRGKECKEEGTCELECQEESCSLGLLWEDD